MRPLRPLSLVMLVLAACSSDPPAPVDAASDIAPTDAPPADAPSPDAADASDVTDASDAADASDVADVTDAGDVADARDVADAADTGGAVHTFCEGYAQALCQRWVFCRTSVESGAACIVREMATCERERAPFVAALRAGTLTYDARASEACLSSLPEVLCVTNSLIAASPRCNEVFRGTVANGGRCDPMGAPVCANGYCPALATACPATCLPFAADAMPCDDTRLDGAPCAPGLACVARVCRPALAAGTRCEASPTACAPGLACVSAGGAATCFARLPASVACTANDQCVSRLCAGGFCAGGLDANAPCTLSLQCPENLSCIDVDPGPGLDRRCAMGAAAGAPCTAMANTCGIGLACSGDAAGSVCVLAYPGNGDACAGACPGSLWCRPNTDTMLGTCVRNGAAGAACSASDPYGTCIAPAVCAPEGTCRAPGAVGATCRTGFDRMCADGLFCGPDGRCATRAAAGAPCVAGDRACVDGYRCTAGRCVAATAYGAACASPAECLGGVCFMGRCAGFCAP